MPVVVTDERKLPLGVHRVQMHRVQASIPYSRNLSREKTFANLAVFEYQRQFYPRNFGGGHLTLGAWQIARASSLACSAAGRSVILPRKDHVFVQVLPVYQHATKLFGSLCFCVALFAYDLVSELRALLLYYGCGEVETTLTHACSARWACFLRVIILYANSRKFSPSKDSRYTVPYQSMAK